MTEPTLPPDTNKGWDKLESAIGVDYASPDEEEQGAAMDLTRPDRWEQQ